MFKTIIFLTLFSSLANAECTIMKMTPQPPDSNGCVGWVWEYTPPSATNCPPPVPIGNTNPLARPTIPADPEDCIYLNRGGHAINLCLR